MIDEKRTDVGNGEGFTLGLHRLVSMMETKSNNALTSSIYSSMSKFIPKWAKYFLRGLHNKTPQICDRPKYQSY